MFEQRDRSQAQQGEFWIVRDRLPQATAGTFYQKLDATLQEIGFAAGIRDICRPAYQDQSAGGRPGVDPAVYFKMLMIGFFENLPSERAIASRCADSLSLRAFLGYDLSEATPDHSTLSVIRSRLGLEIFQQAFELILKALHQYGLLKGKNLGIDSSIIEANASLRELHHRNTEEAYWDYVKKLAEENGINPEDTKAVRKFDKKRKGRKTSNKDWFNPHDPEAKVGRTKDGATDMVYKPEHVTDLDSGAIVQAEVRLGDAGDSEELAVRVQQACQTVDRVREAKKARQPRRSLTTDEGYFSAQEVHALQQAGLRTVMGDPHEARRRKDQQDPSTRQALRKAKTAVKSKSGKAQLRKRGQHLERSFAHVLDHGGMRRATLKGVEALSKRLIAAALTYNLSLLMRKLIGCGTPKQWLAMASFALLFGLRALLKTILLHLQAPGGQNINNRLSYKGKPSMRSPAYLRPHLAGISTGC